MIWVARTMRGGLLECLEGSRVPSDFEAFQEFGDVQAFIGEGEDGPLALIYRQPPDRVGVRPSIVIAAEHGLRDFFAWSWTYLNQLRPLTAYYRVLTPSTLARSARSRGYPPSLGSLEGACVGLVLAEVASYVPDRFEVSRLSLLACQGTFGFIAARSIALGGSPSEDKLADDWVAFRRSTGQGDLRTPIEVVKAPWRVLLALADRSRYVQEDEPDAAVIAVAHELYRERGLSSLLWDRLFAESGVPGTSISEFVSGRREERVIATEKLLKRLAAVERPMGDAREFLAALAVSLIAPGTLEHGGLFQPYQSQLPGALLWYGLCAGLQASDQAGRTGLFPSTVARRLLRELILGDDLLDQPRADIALAELQVLTTAPAHDMMSHLRTAIPGLITVELGPGILGTTKWASQRLEESAPESQQRSMFASSREENAGLLYELRDTLDLANFLARRLSSLVTRVGRPPHGVDRDDAGASRDPTTRRRKRR